VCHVLDFISNNQMREGGGDLRGLGVILLRINEKNQFLLLGCVPCLSSCIVSRVGCSAAVYLPLCLRFSLLACKMSAGLHRFILWLVFGSGYQGYPDARFLLCIGCLRPELIQLCISECAGLILCKSRSCAWSTSLLAGLVSPARVCLWCLRVQFFCCLSQSCVPAPDKATASEPVCVSGGFLPPDFRLPSLCGSSFGQLVFSTSEQTLPSILCCSFWPPSVGANQAGDFFCCAAVDESLQGEADIALESPDQKTRGFVIQITLPR
jgi:hypothetical protein